MHTHTQAHTHRGTHTNEHSDYTNLNLHSLKWAANRNCMKCQVFYQYNIYTYLDLFHFPWSKSFQSQQQLTSVLALPPFWSTDQSTSCWTQSTNMNISFWSTDQSTSCWTQSKNGWTFYSSQLTKVPAVGQNQRMGEYFILVNWPK